MAVPTARAAAVQKTLFAFEQARADIARRRVRWRSFQGRLDPQRLVFIDETWIKTNMAPLRGWGPKGKRLRGFAPHGHWRTQTFIGALRCNGFVAPCVFDGPINGQCFRAWSSSNSWPCSNRRHYHYGHVWTALLMQEESFRRARSVVG